MTARLRPGDRVRHMLDDLEGIVERISASGRMPTVVVRLDAGGTAELPQGEWERLPAIGSLSA